MKTELFYLVMVSLFTALIWIPYVIDRLLMWGIPLTLGYPAVAPAVSPWAARMKAAHVNAIENLAVFAPLVLTVNAMGLTNTWTIGACSVYFWARVAHLISYSFAIPVVRTLSFVAGSAAQVVLSWQALVALGTNM